MSVYLDIKSLHPHLKVNWNVLMCKICIARRLVVDIFPWCNANFVPFPSGTLVAHRMGNRSIVLMYNIRIKIDMTLMTWIWEYFQKQQATFMNQDDEVIYLRKNPLTLSVPAGTNTGWRGKTIKGINPDRAKSSGNLISKQSSGWCLMNDTAEVLILSTILKKSASTFHTSTAALQEKWIPTINKHICSCFKGKDEYNKMLKTAQPYHDSYNDMPLTDSNTFS